MFSRLNNSSSPSPSPYLRLSCPLNLFVTSSGLPPAPPRPFCTWWLRAGHSSAQPSRSLDTEFKMMAPASSRCQWKLQNGETTSKPGFIYLSFLQDALWPTDRGIAPLYEKMLSPARLLSNFFFFFEGWLKNLRSDFRRGRWLGRCYIFIEGTVEMFETFELVTQFTDIATDS